jgi:peptide/nickel transport system permease protein
MDPLEGRMINRLKPIGTEGHLLGTDELGRDMLSRLIWGGRLSLLMGVTPVVLAFFIGSAIGIVAGYAGGWVNTIIMRTVDVFYAFPSVLLAVALSGALGAGLGNALLSLTVVFIPPIARVAESVTTRLRTSDFIEAARASGAGALTIVRVHVLGNVLGPIFVYATSLIAVSMILASGLSFLGLGVRPPNPEWGLMLNTLRTAIYVQPWVAALPGAMIFHGVDLVQHAVGRAAFRDGGAAMTTRRGFAHRARAEEILSHQGRHSGAHGQECACRRRCGP